MIISIEAWPVILLIKCIKISIDRFHLSFRIKGMIISIQVWPMILLMLIKGIRISIERFHLLFRIKCMIISVKVWSMILLIKGVKIAKKIILLNFNYGICCI